MSYYVCPIRRFFCFVSFRAQHISKTKLLRQCNEQVNKSPRSWPQFEVLDSTCRVWFTWWIFEWKIWFGQRERLARSGSSLSINVSIRSDTQLKTTFPARVGNSFPFETCMRCVVITAIHPVDVVRLCDGIIDHNWINEHEIESLLDVIDMAISNWIIPFTPFLTAE